MIITRAGKIGSASLIPVTGQREITPWVSRWFATCRPGYFTDMWFALGTPVVLMVAAVLMERLEQRCTRVSTRAARGERAGSDELPRPVVTPAVVLRH